MVGAGGPGLLVAADQEDRVVGAGGHRQRDQQVHRARGQLDDLEVTQRGHQPAGHRHLDEHHHQQQDHRRDRAVEEQQHHDDHREGHQQDAQQAALAGDVHVGGQRGRAGQVDLYAGRRRRSVDDVADGRHRFVGLGLAHVAGEVHRDVGRSAVRTLRGGFGQRVAPHVLDAADARSRRARRRPVAGRSPGRSSRWSRSRTPRTAGPCRTSPASTGRRSDSSTPRSGWPPPPAEEPGR